PLIARGFRAVAARNPRVVPTLGPCGLAVSGDSDRAGWGAVYLRHTVVRKGGRAHTYWRLVRSVRRGRKVVQETAAHLGELDGEGRVRARQLAQAIKIGRASCRERGWISGGVVAVEKQ